MPIYFNALIVCDRCDAERTMDDCDNEAEVENRLCSGETGWSLDEDGYMVCLDCWNKWDAEQRLKQAPAVDAGATTPGKGATESAQRSSSPAPGDPR